MIYSPRAWPKVNQSHIAVEPQKNLFIFHVDMVDLRDNYKEMLFF